MVEIRVCPLCLSPRIVPYLGGICGQLYKCPDCGYVGPIVLIVEEEELGRLAGGSGRQANKEVRTKHDG